MKCPKCGSENVNVQVINEVELKNKHHGLIYWLCGGWILTILKWLFLTVPALILKLFGHKKKKVKNIQKTMCICQQCGNSWEQK